MSKEEFPKEEDLKNKVTPDEAEKETQEKDAETQADDPKALALQAKVEELTAKNQKLEDSYLRSQAEIQNMQTRYTKERAQLIKYEAQNLAKDVLPAVDNLERALAVKADDEAAKQLQKGVQMTLDALVKALNDHGIEEIEAEGVAFDPTLHQAVQTVAADDDHPVDHVVQVLQKGYKYKDRTLRPAMVVVAQ